MRRESLFTVCMSAGYDFWLFDLDGTLVDVEPSYVHAVMRAVGDRVGHRLSDRQAERLWHGIGATPEELLARWGIDPGAFWTAFHEVEDPIARAEASYLHPDAAVVGDLGAPVGIVTHCQDYLTGPVLEAVDVRDWFDAVVCCSEDTGWKPDPRPVERAIAELPDAGSSGVLVGDTPTDIGAAWNAGLDAVHVERHGPERRGCCVRADRRIGALDELLEA